MIAMWIVVLVPVGQVLARWGRTVGVYGTAGTTPLFNCFVHRAAHMLWVWPV